MPEEIGVARQDDENARERRGKAVDDPAETARQPGTRQEHQQHDRDRRHQQRPPARAEVSQEADGIGAIADEKVEQVPGRQRADQRQRRKKPPAEALSSKRRERQRGQHRAQAENGIDAQE